jgi:hypothetical protein
MFDFLKPYVGLIKVALFVILIACVAISYVVVFRLGVSQERGVWELKVAEAERAAAEQRLKDLEDFNRKINANEVKSAEELARAMAQIKGFEDYVASIQEDSSCLTDADTRKLRDLWNGPVKGGPP